MSADTKPFRLPRNTLVIVADALALVGCFFLSAMLARISFGGPMEWALLAVTFAVGMVTFRQVGMYRAIWRFASLPDLRNILTATTIVSLTLIAASLLILPTGARLAHGLVFWFVLLVMLSGPRLAYRYYREWLATNRRREDERIPRALLVGTPDEVGNLISGFSRTSGEHFTIAGILSSKERDRDRSVQGVRVLGTTSDIETVLDRQEQFGAPIQNLILSGKSLSEGENVAGIFAVARRRGLHIFRFADMTASQIVARGAAPGLRPLNPEDVLIRPIVQIDRSVLSSFAQPRRFLVTGGAGSIGSLLVEALINYGAREVIAVDISETNIARLLQSGRIQHGRERLKTVIADVRSARDIERAFRQARPDVVIHAAALKHVDLAEINAVETFRTNVLGTINVVAAAYATAAQSCILISTDKAVEPVSVLGRTKRAAELYMEAAARNSSCQLATVRFGNVLGTEGSAVPLFLSQIARGGPVTVTDERVSRYFMTADEARDMILAVATLIGQEGTDSSLFLLDMGQPIGIKDLAERLIRLSGLEVGSDIRIDLVGLRPGERLDEKLTSSDESYRKTSLPGVLAVERARIDPALLEAQIARLTTLAESGDDESMRKALGEAFGWPPLRVGTVRTGT